MGARWGQSRLLLTLLAVEPHSVCCFRECRFRLSLVSQAFSRLSAGRIQRLVRLGYRLHYTRRFSQGAACCLKDDGWRSSWRWYHHCVLCACLDLSSFRSRRDFRCRLCFGHFVCPREQIWLCPPNWSLPRCDWRPHWIRRREVLRVES